jgi:hypothetical protein
MKQSEYIENALKNFETRKAEMLLWGMNAFTERRLSDPPQTCGRCRFRSLTRTPSGIRTCAKAKTTNAQWSDCPDDFPACSLFEVRP